MILKNSNIDPRIIQLFLAVILFVFQQLTSQFAQNIFLTLGLLIFSFLLEKVLNIFFKEKKSWESSVLTAFSLALLFRASHWGFMFLAVFLALISKRVIRVKKNHIFNPSNFAIVLLLVLMPGEVWVASGVWLKNWLGLVFVFILGLITTIKARRLGISLAFLLSYLVLHGLRLLWLGDPMSLLFFRLNTISIIVFTFFMISDPKTTPQSQLGRVVFAFCVASIAYVYDAMLFERNGLFYALAIASPTLVVLNYFFKGERYLWPGEN